jgi:hypothetical protein
MVCKTCSANPVAGDCQDGGRPYPGPLAQAWRVQRWRMRLARGHRSRAPATAPDKFVGAGPLLSSGEICHDPGPFVRADCAPCRTLCCVAPATKGKMGRTVPAFERHGSLPDSCRARAKGGHGGCLSYDCLGAGRMVRKTCSANPVAGIARMVGGPCPGPLAQARRVREWRRRLATRASLARIGYRPR